MGRECFDFVPGAIYCGREGLFVGSTPLLDRDNKGAWRVRPIEHLNRELSNRYGLPVDVATKSASLGYIALALDRDELALAQIAALKLHFPEPPSLEKSLSANHDVDALAAELYWGGLLKGGWDPAKHPRTGAPPNRGQFAIVPKESKPLKPTRSGWPVPEANRKIRAKVAEITLARAAKVGAHLIPIVDVVAFIIDVLTPDELNNGEDRVNQQLMANFDPPKTIEELQKTPTEYAQGYELHHIVEQNDDNIAKDVEARDPFEKFGRDAIDDPSNLVWVPRLKHEQITAEYNSKYEMTYKDDDAMDDDDFYKPIKRRIVNQKSFDEQRAMGLDALRRYGVLK